MTQRLIPFHKPFIHSSAKQDLANVLESARSLFEGDMNRQCKNIMLDHYDCPDVVFTPSCTDALTMASLVLDLQPGDEVILPAFTFVSVANAFANRGIVVRLADSAPYHPNPDATSIASLLNDKTRAIVFMSYGGDAEGIEKVQAVAVKNQLWLIEDAAHSYDATYQGKPVGSFGHLSCFSFHESKSIHCGQGGMMVINDPVLAQRARIIKTHGADKSKGINGGAVGYNWDMLGGEFNLPELSVAFLSGQLRLSGELKKEREILWKSYFDELSSFAEGKFKLPAYSAGSNYSIFYIVSDNKSQRDNLIAFLESKGISAAFHYTGLHNSNYYRSYGEARSLAAADRFANHLIRLPLYNGLEVEDVIRVCTLLREFYKD